MYQAIIQTLKCLLLGTLPTEVNRRNENTYDSIQNTSAEERAREIQTDLNLIIQSEQKELCFLAFQLLLDTKHVDLLLNVRAFPSHNS